MNASHNNVAKTCRTDHCNISKRKRTTSPLAEVLMQYRIPTHHHEEDKWRTPRSLTQKAFVYQTAGVILSFNNVRVHMQNKNKWKGNYSTAVVETRVPDVTTETARSTGAALQPPCLYSEDFKPKDITITRAILLKKHFEYGGILNINLIFNHHFVFGIWTDWSGLYGHTAAVWNRWAIS